MLSKSAGLYAPGPGFIFLNLPMDVLSAMWYFDPYSSILPVVLYLGPGVFVEYVALLLPVPIFHPGYFFFRFANLVCS